MKSRTWSHTHYNNKQEEFIFLFLLSHNLVSRLKPLEKLKSILNCCSHSHSIIPNAITYLPIFNYWFSINMDTQTKARLHLPVPQLALLMIPNSNNLTYINQLPDSLHLDLTDHFHRYASSMTALLDAVRLNESHVKYS